MSVFRLASRVAAVALIVSTHQLAAPTAESELTFTRLWTYGHQAPQVSEIPAFDPRTNTIWVAGVVGVDVLDAGTGARVAHIDVTPHGAVNSVAIHNGLAALAVEAASRSTACPSCDRRNPGKVLFYDTSTRQPSGVIQEIGVGSLPDMLTFTHDGSRLLVANEGTPNPATDESYVFDDAIGDPIGSVTIIDMATRAVIANATPGGAPTSGDHIRLASSVGMDFEPEYIAVSHDGTTAFVTLQEANAIGVLDLVTNQFIEVIGLGAKDFSAPDNEIDPKDDDGEVLFQSVAARGLYMPDAIATYKWRGETFLVMANEGDFREDNDDRSAASTFGAVAPLDRLRVSNRDSTPGDLYAAGARSFSIRRTNGELVYDSGSILDTQAHISGIYDDRRSRDKGVEPEGVALLDIGSRTYAFIGLERTTVSSVAIFDITNPAESRFVDLIVTPGDLSPEGLAAYKYRGRFYLAISNEVPGASGTSNTTLYLIEPARSS